MREGKCEGGKGTVTEVDALCSELPEVRGGAGGVVRLCGVPPGVGGGGQSGRRAGGEGSRAGLGRGKARKTLPHRHIVDWDGGCITWSEGRVYPPHCHAIDDDGDRWRTIHGPGARHRFFAVQKIKNRLF